MSCDPEPDLIEATGRCTLRRLANHHRHRADTGNEVPVVLFHAAAYALLDAVRVMNGAVKAAAHVGRMGFGYAAAERMAQAYAALDVFEALETGGGGYIGQKGQGARQGRSQGLLSQPPDGGAVR